MGFVLARLAAGGTFGRMGFQFAETMEGTIEWDAEPGVRRPFRFEVTAEAASTRAHLRDGKAVLRGIVTAPPLAGAARAEGEITIRPLGEKIIRYELRFVGDDGAPYELVGQKDIRFRSPLQSFTSLPGEILDQEHRRIGTCLTRFDLKRDLWSFVRSFRLV